jgi:hypothetical protein
MVILARAGFKAKAKQDSIQNTSNRSNIEDFTWKGTCTGNSGLISQIFGF